MKTLLFCLFVCFCFFVMPSVAFAQSGIDPVARNQATDAAQAVAVLARQVGELRAQVVAEKKLDGGGDKKKLVELEKKLVELEKKLADEIARPDCSKLTGEAQTQCFQLTSEGTNQRLIEAYEQALVGQPASVQTNADKSMNIIFPVAQPGVTDNGGSETITITEGPTGSFKQVKRVRYQPLPAMFPSVAGKDDGGVHPIVKWLVPVAAGALAGGAIAGMADPDGPDGDNYSFGSAGKGAMLGAATGLVFSLVWEIRTDE